MYSTTLITTLLGRYYPAISCYMGGRVRVNFGPDFEYCPPLIHGQRPRPISELERDVADASRDQCSTIPAVSSGSTVDLASHNDAADVDASAADLPDVASSQAQPAEASSLTETSAPEAPTPTTVAS
jgi:hypothetical protein